MSATTGIAAIGTYGEALRSARVAELLTYIPDPDSTSSSGSVAGGTNGTNNTYLDEMSPACATQLRVELNAIIATLSSADGQYTVTAGDATNTFIDIVTGIPVFTLANTSWSIRRAGSLVSQGVGSQAVNGTLHIAAGGVGTLVVTAGDIVTWYVRP